MKTRPSRKLPAKWLSVFFVAVLVVIAAFSAESFSDWRTSSVRLDEKKCQTYIDDLRAALPGNWPDVWSDADSERDFARRLSEHFNANDLIEALPGLSMKPGWRLAYEWSWDGPQLYAAPSGSNSADAPQVSAQSRSDKADRIESLSKSKTSRELSFTRYVETDGSPESHFQLVALAVMGSNFWRFGQALYEEDWIVASESGLPRRAKTEEDLLEFSVPDDTREKAQELRLSPTAVTRGDYVDISVIAFNKWEGFSRVTFTLNTRGNVPIRLAEKEILLQYDCGIFF